ncbi:flotillin family protein [Myxococcota bacterium]|nr:flotillin family protein [Myxococcota bacterium]MBU1433182.1 flotillin family protein [Myxococcota bacterium]MBU1896193.1 flotillin family protein [Myxococcota bacterium]
MLEVYIAGAVVVGLILLVLLAKSLLFICPPNEVLIFSGRQHRLADGTTRGFRLVFGGRGWRIPIIEMVDRMSLNVIEVSLSIRGAYSKGGIALNVSAIANVKISSDRAVIGNAIERFLGRDLGEVRRVAKETLEGHLREVLAKLTPEEVNESRLKFAQQLQADSSDDLRKLGIHLDTLKIQQVADDVSYLDSIGREAIANVVKDAEMAESDAKRIAAEEEAAQIGRAEVKKSEADAAISRLKNQLRQAQAELEQQVKSAEERTLAAAREARALAEQELQRVRAGLESLRLSIDQVMPAEAHRRAAAFTARGEAATIRAHGEAVRGALDQLRAAWAQAGDAAMQIYVIDQLEHILEVATEAVGRVHIDHLNLIDGGDGRTLAAYIGAYPAMLDAVFAAIARTTGVDVPQVLTRAGVAAPALPVALEKD